MNIRIFRVNAVSYEGLTECCMYVCVVLVCALAACAVFDPCALISSLLVEYTRVLVASKLLLLFVSDRPFIFSCITKLSLRRRETDTDTEKEKERELEEVEVTAQLIRISLGLHSK